MTLAIVFLLVAGSASAALAQAPQKNPYKNLFKPQDLKVVTAQPQLPGTIRQPRMERGRAVIPMDPCVDPKIFINRRPTCS